MTPLNLRKVLLAVALMLIAGAIYYFDSQKAARPRLGDIKNAEIAATPETAGPGRTMTIAEKEKLYPRAKELTGIAGYLNLPPDKDKITVAELIGKKVVMIDFWTYTCINCQRTTPYLNSWYQKYREEGLEIIGVHTPEFEYEKEYAKVAKAIRNERIEYPVAQDNDYATWTVYGNRYWPRKYLIDIDGFIVYDHIGEGAYEETEKKIQELLAERITVLGTKETVAGGISRPVGAEEVDFTKVRSPEVYFGAARNELLGNGSSATLETQSLSAPADPELNKLYLAGDWDFTREYAENKNAGAKIIFRYQAQKVFFVAGADQDITVQVIKNGVLIKRITIKDLKLYRLLDDDYGEHTLELLIETPGLQAFTFTFG